MPTITPSLPVGKKKREGKKIIKGRKREEERMKF